MQRAAMSRNGGGGGGGASETADAANPLGPMEATLSCLWVLTPLTATLSLLVVIVAMFTNQWLHTEEKMNNPSYNGTGEKDYLSKLTISGLWMLCFTNPGETLYDCNKIDYFTKEEYSPDPGDSTMAIPYTVTRSVAFFLAASFLLCAGYSCCLLGQCVRHRALYTFVSGVIFIVTGLVMLLGLIMYISIFKAEIGSKLRPRSPLQPPVFDYRYGYSFLLYVIGLITTQLAGISSIFLFIYKVQYEWSRKRLDDMRRGKTRPPSPLPYGAGGGGRSYEAQIFYPTCRRHPQAYVNSNSAIHFPASYPSPVSRQKRYFFSKEPPQESPCSVHNRHQPANSLKLKEAASFYDFPPPPTISYQFDEPLLERPRFPRDLTATTVSTTTTADVNTCDDFDYSPDMQPLPPHHHDHDFVTFDLEQPLPLLRAPSSASILMSGAANNRNKPYDNNGGDTLRRTTPV